MAMENTVCFLISQKINNINLGYSMAISGYEWQHNLPIFEEFLKKNNYYYFYQLRIFI